MKQKNEKSVLKSNTENINAKAFVKGTQGEKIDDFLAEIEADFEKKREEKTSETVEAIKTLEAETEIARQRKDDAEKR